MTSPTNGPRIGTKSAGALTVKTEEGHESPPRKGHMSSALQQDQEEEISVSSNVSYDPTTYGIEETEFKENQTQQTPRLMTPRGLFFATSGDDKSPSSAGSTKRRQPVLRQLGSNSFYSIASRDAAVSHSLVHNDKRTPLSSPEKRREQVPEERRLQRSSSEKSVISIQEHFKNLCQVAEDLSLDSIFSTSPPSKDNWKSATIGGDDHGSKNNSEKSKTPNEQQQHIESTTLPYIQATPDQQRRSSSADETPRRPSPGLPCDSGGRTKLQQVLSSDAPSTPARQNSPGLEALTSVERLSMKHQEAVADSLMEDDEQSGGSPQSSESTKPIHDKDGEDRTGRTGTVDGEPENSRQESREEHSQGKRDQASAVQCLSQCNISTPAVSAAGAVRSEDPSECHTVKPKRQSPRARLRSSIERLKSIREKLRSDTPTPGGTKTPASKKRELDAHERHGLAPQERLESIRQRLQIVLLPGENTHRSINGKKHGVQRVESERKLAWQTPREASRDDPTESRQKVVTFSFPEAAETQFHSAAQHRGLASESSQMPRSLPRLSSVSRTKEEVELLTTAKEDENDVNLRTVLRYEMANSGSFNDTRMRGLEILGDLTWSCKEHPEFLLKEERTTELLRAPIEQEDTVATSASSISFESEPARTIRSKGHSKSPSEDIPVLRIQSSNDPESSEETHSHLSSKPEEIIETSRDDDHNEDAMATSVLSRPLDLGPSRSAISVEETGSQALNNSSGQRLESLRDLTPRHHKDCPNILSSQGDTAELSRCSRQDEPTTRTFGASSFEPEPVRCTASVQKSENDSSHQRGHPNLASQHHSGGFKLCDDQMGNDLVEDQTLPLDNLADTVHVGVVGTTATANAETLTKSALAMVNNEDMGVDIDMPDNRPCMWRDKEGESPEKRKLSTASLEGATLDTAAVARDVGSISVDAHEDQESHSRRSCNQSYVQNVMISTIPVSTRLIPIRLASARSNDSDNGKQENQTGDSDVSCSSLMDHEENPTVEKMGVSSSAEMIDAKDTDATTPKAEILIPTITPVRSVQNDEYEWAYEVWRSHGLMGRKKGPRVCKSSEQTIEMFHTPKSINLIEWDFSPAATTCSWTTAGESRAKEFSRNSSGNFGDLLAQWKEVGTNPFRSPLDYRASPNRYDPPPITAFLRAVTKQSVPVVNDDAESDEDVDTTEGDEFDFTKDFDDFQNFGSDENYISSSHTQVCACSNSIFSGNDELLNFFLPKLGMACTCGADPDADTNQPSDPTAIEHILRPWQCRFLHSFGIHRGDQLVKANHRSASALAKGMTRWRKKERMTQVRTVACGMALHIWSRTCKVYIRGVRKQLAAGVEVIQPPDPLGVLSSLLDGDEQHVPVPLEGSRSSHQKEVELQSKLEI